MKRQYSPVPVCGEFGIITRSNITPNATDTTFSWCSVNECGEAYIFLLTSVTTCEFHTSFINLHRNKIYIYITENNTKIKLFWTKQVFTYQLQNVSTHRRKIQAYFMDSKVRIFQGKPIVCLLHNLFIYLLCSRYRETFVAKRIRMHFKFIISIRF